MSATSYETHAHAPATKCTVPKSLYERNTHAALLTTDICHRFTLV